MNDSVRHQFLDCPDNRAATDFVGGAQFRLAGKPVARLEFSIQYSPTQNVSKDNVSRSKGELFHE